jgi:hypothetical protein
VDRFYHGKASQILSEKFNRIAQGKLKRLIVCLPPRHSKSEFASTFFPAWMMGLNPSLKIIQATHTAELAVRFGRRVRNIIDSEDYQSIFPNISLSDDNKSAGRWTTNAGWRSFLFRVGGAITGRGADLLIIDDPHSEQDAMSPTAMDAAWEWYTSGPRQRLQPGGTIILVMTRWSTKDLAGRLLKRQNEEHADKWELVEFPAIMPDSEEPLWGEFWKKEGVVRCQSITANFPSGMLSGCKTQSQKVALLLKESGGKLGRKTIYRHANVLYKATILPLVPKKPLTIRL